MSHSPPHAMSEVEYDAIEAAVGETARGRRFLSEHARRSRMAETAQLLEAMARLEAAVSGGPAARPAGEPSIRLLTHRIKEIAGRLGDVVDEMRASGVEEHLADAIEVEARGVAGLMRGTTPSLAGEPAPVPRRLSNASAIAASSPQQPSIDPRLDVLAGLDALSLKEKLTLFR